MTTELNGVTLAQYATVRAGLVDGVDAAALFELSEVEAGQWAIGEAAWDAHLLKALETAEVATFEALERATEAARKQWERSIVPLDEDPQAWFDFFRAFTSSADPLAMLGEHGLALADVMTLQRRWSSRLQNEEALRSQVMVILATDPGAIGEVRVGPIRLLHSPKRGASQEARGIVDDTESTASVPVLRPSEIPLMPFQDGVAKAMPPSLIVALPEPRSSSGDDATQQARALTEADLLAPLPFAEPSVVVVGAEAPEKATPVSIAENVALDAPPTLAADADEDTLLPSDGVSVVALPPQETRFETEAIDTRAFAALRAQAALPFAAPASPAPAMETDTIDVRELQKLRRQPALPFAGTPRLALELHASLCAEIGLFPEEMGRLLLEVGLTLREKVEEDALWKRIFASDPSVERRWFRAYEERRAELSKRSSR